MKLEFQEEGTENNSQVVFSPPSSQPGYIMIIPVERKKKHNSVKIISSRVIKNKINTKKKNPKWPKSPITPQNQQYLYEQSRKQHTKTHRYWRKKHTRRSLTVRKRAREIQRLVLVLDCSSSSSPSMERERKWEKRGSATQSPISQRGD